MPLDQPGLKSRLKTLYTTEFPATALIAAQEHAKAYRKYMELAASCGSAGVPPLPAVLDAREIAMGSAAALGGAFAANNPATLAAGWVSALTVFWTGLPFPGAAPGLAAPPTAVGTMPALLVANWANSVLEKWDADKAATELANLLHTVTQSVLVTHGPTPPCSGPLI